MILIKRMLVFIMIINLTSCSTAIIKSEIINSDTSYVKQTMERVPVVDVKISLIDTVLKYGDNILLNISLTNNGNKVQKLLFDKPVISTSWPWEITGDVIDIKTKSSVVELKNKALLRSHIYTEDELKDAFLLFKSGTNYKHTV